MSVDTPAHPVLEAVEDYRDAFDLFLQARREQDAVSSAVCVILMAACSQKREATVWLPSC